MTACRMAGELPAGRCLSLRTLRLIAEQREWTGIPSTTQLLKGTREAYLEIITDYAVNPQDALWMVNGTKVHKILEQYHDNALGEERLYDEVCSGQFDFYDPADRTLWDLKTWGSYKIMKAQGLQQIEVDTGEVYKTGAKKGQPKMRKEWVDGGEPDLFNEEIQLNDYRMKLESAGFPVDKMFIEALCRDGNTYMAKQRGIEQAGVLIPIQRLPDLAVRAYLSEKSCLLIMALGGGSVPSPCDERETWQGRKCETYCNVREACKGEHIREAN